MQNMKTSKLLIVQPLLAGYRRPFFGGLCTHFDQVIVMAGVSCPKSGFEEVVSSTRFKTIGTPIWRISGGKLYWQDGVVSHVIRSRPSAIFVVADFRALHFWVLLALARIMGLPLYAHGQGLFKKTERSNFFMHRLAVRYVCSMATSYVCYNLAVRDQLLKFGLPIRKLSVVRNTLEFISTADPRIRKQNTSKLIFLGRLRAGHGLDLLFEAMVDLEKSGRVCELAVIGAGPDLQRLTVRAKDLSLNVSFYGPQHDSAEIARIAHDAQIGVYPGDAGLSVIHYMALGLVPVTHSHMARHMGPEPAELCDKSNARMFRRADVSDLVNVLAELIDDPVGTKEMACIAYDHYTEMTRIPMATQLADIIRARSMP